MIEITSDLSRAATVRKYYTHRSCYVVETLKKLPTGADNLEIVLNCETPPKRLHNGKS